MAYKEKQVLKDLRESKEKLVLKALRDCKELLVLRVSKAQLEFKV